MPLGTIHDETGWLNEADGWIVLRRDEGGQWVLWPTRRLRKLVGKRVRLVGERIGFNELEARSVDPLDQPPQGKLST